MTSIHPDYRPPRLKPIRDPLHRLKLDLNGRRSRIFPPTDSPAFCLGLAKAGTHTLADMVASHARSAHEPEPGELLRLMPSVRAGEADDAAVRRLLRSRHRRLRLDFESSHLLGTFAPYLVELFPTSRYVLLVRDCRSWINSMVNDQLYVRTTPGYPMWRTVYEQYLGPAPASFPAGERVLEELELAPLAHYVRFWCEEIETIMATVPESRLLVVETSSLAQRTATLARFLGLPTAQLEVRHSYRASAARDVLSELDPDHLAAQLRAAEPVAQRVARRASATP